MSIEGDLNSIAGSLRIIAEEMIKRNELFAEARDEIKASRITSEESKARLTEMEAVEKEFKKSGEKKAQQKAAKEKEAPAQEDPAGDALPKSEAAASLASAPTSAATDSGAATAAATTSESPLKFADVKKKFFDLLNLAKDVHPKGMEEGQRLFRAFTGRFTGGEKVTPESLPTENFAPMMAAINEEWARLEELKNKAA